jgi:spermidine synthase
MQVKALMALNEIFYENSNVLYSGMAGSDRVRVIQQGNIRSLLFGYGVAHLHCEIDVTDLRRHVSSYSKTTMYSLMFNASPKDILVAGLGGGVVPREMGHYLPDSNIDVMELYPEVLTLAKDFFFFGENDRMKVKIGDAFVTVQGLKKKYDLVFLDAFGTSYAPPQLLSQEFFSFVKTVCHQDAIVVANMFPAHISFYAHMKTMIDSFGDDIYAIKCPTRDDEIPVGNVIMVFSLGGRKPDQQIPLPEQPYPRDVIPSPFPITKEINDAKLFSLRKRKGV